MPPKKRVELPDRVRAALLADLALTHQEALAADERDKIRIYLATEQGLNMYEIAAELGISQASVSKYTRLGREALARRAEKRERESEGDRRTDGDPVRPGERAEVG